MLGWRRCLHTVLTAFQPRVATLCAPPGAAGGGADGLFRRMRFLPRAAAAVGELRLQDMAAARSR